MYKLSPDETLNLWKTVQETNNLKFWFLYKARSLSDVLLSFLSLSFGLSPKAAHCVCTALQVWVPYFVNEKRQFWNNKIWYGNTVVCKQNRKRNVFLRNNVTVFSIRQSFLSCLTTVLDVGYRLLQFCLWNKFLYQDIFFLAFLKERGGNLKEKKKKSFVLLTKSKLKPFVHWKIIFQMISISLSQYNITLD